MTTASTTAFSHVGICVSDLGRSLRFYCDGLGFERGESIPIDATFGAALEVPGDLSLTSQFIRRDGLAIELLHYVTPAPTGRPSEHRNQLGLTHLSFYVDDVDATATALVAAGGTSIESTRTTSGGIDLLFLRDPDGVRVELMKVQR
ncbi:MAG TPA: VOC family protein [Acidimicrobiales bacterium]|jgi:lactoylglutathione lyase|nr:VOC family protein [Acidimicrobiales bacterium]